MTELLTFGDEHRNLFVVEGFERRICIYVFDLNIEDVVLLQQLKRVQHVLAKMTVGAAVEDQQWLITCHCQLSR